MVFLLCGGEGVAFSDAAVDVVAPSSSRGKGKFKLSEELLDIVVLVGGGFGELAESLLDDLVAMRGSGG